MIYVLKTMELPRNKVQEAWQCYQNKVAQWDKQTVEKVGGKYIGFWCTEFGRVGEITLLLEYPSWDAREKVLEAIRQVQDEEIKKGLAEWASYVPTQDVKLLRPLPLSPLD